MKAKITTFLHGLITYDYILFGSVFGLFLLFLILAILLRKNTVISIVFMLLAFIILFVGPTIGYVKMHEYLFKNSVELISQKKLSFTNAIVIKGKLTNESKKDFKSCKITASAHKVSKKKIKTFLYSFKSFKNMSIVEDNIMVGESRNFKIIGEPFAYSKDYNISIKAKCN